MSVSEEQVRKWMLANPERAKRIIPQVSKSPSNIPESVITSQDQGFDLKNVYCS
jgi:hypothetical protein